MCYFSRSWKYHSVCSVWCFTKVSLRLAFNCLIYWKIHIELKLKSAKCRKLGSIDQIVVYCKRVILSSSDNLFYLLLGISYILVLPSALKLIRFLLNVIIAFWKRFLLHAKSFILSSFESSLNEVIYKRSWVSPKLTVNEGIW